jgi:signal transduction histidine kinase
MAVLHIPTVYLVIGSLYLLLPLTVLMVLHKQRSRAASFWCLGGEVLGIGLLLIGLRAQLVPWVSYTLANGLMWSGILLQALALRHTLAHDWVFKRSAVGVIACLCVFEFFRTILQDHYLRFAWSMLVFISVFVYISYLAWCIYSKHQLKSAKWLCVVYAITAIAMFVRMERVLMGLAEPDVVAHGVDSVLTVVTGFLISILGNFAFIGMFIERATQSEIKAVTARAQQEESARFGTQVAHLERQRTLGAMSASFAHELSQPLTAILMDAQTIKASLISGDSGTQEILESIQEIENSTYRTAKLVERIRNFIRPAKSDYEAIDLKILLHDVSQLLAYEIKTQHVHFELDLDATKCLVFGDRVQLSQIVLNVYRNAIQAMCNSTTKTIYVSLEQLGDRVVLRVRDSGPGIAESIKDLVGQPFVTSKEDGLGVGLSISKTIAQMHGGSLHISNAKHGGAIVELNLPALNVADLA